MTAAELAQFQVGDLITLGKVREDGVIADDDRLPLQRWRVVYVGPEGVQLHVVTDDPARDAFNNEAGDFWIR